MSGIKLKVWDEANKKFLFDDIVHEAGGICCSGTSSLDEKYDIVRHTGLKDKNSKEVYEGHIVIYKVNGKENSKVVGEIGISPVVGTYIQTSTGRYTITGAYEPVVDNLEIIGHVFENPELLKEKTQE